MEQRHSADTRTSGEVFTLAALIPTEESNSASKPLATTNPDTMHHQKVMREAMQDKFQKTKKAGVMDEPANGHVSLIKRTDGPEG